MDIDYGNANLSYSFMQPQLFIKHMLHVRHCARSWEIEQWTKKTKSLLSHRVISSKGRKQ
jgi:hypothetical protein